MIDEIKKNLKTEKLVFGKNQTIKKIQSGEVVKIFLASNCKAEDCNDLEHYCSFNKIPIEKLDVPNTELGVTCKKQFSISVLCLIK